MSENEKCLDFASLKTGSIGMSAAYGSFLAEAASYCLHLKRHPNPVNLSLTGDSRFFKPFQWEALSQKYSKTYGDLQEATEYGACGIAIVIALHVTGMLMSNDPRGVLELTFGCTTRRMIRRIFSSAQRAWRSQAYSRATRTR